MKDETLLRRYAEAGARRIVGSGNQVEAVVLTPGEMEWAQRQMIFESDPLEPQNQIVEAFRRFWLVVVADGQVMVAKPNALQKRAGASGKGASKARTSEQARAAVMARWAKQKDRK